MKKAKKKAKIKHTRNLTASPPRPRMSSANAVFAELEAMSRSEQEEIADQLLDWINENGLGTVS